jgi:hypothetical protein
VARDLKLGVEVTGAAAAERDLNRVGRAADDLGDELQESGRAAVAAGLAYRDHNAKLRDMRGRFLGAAGAAKLLSRELDSVERKARSLGGGGGGGRSGGGLGSGLNFQALPFNPQMLAAGLGVGAAVAPVIGGAALAGAGVGAIGVGLAGGALGSPQRFANEWTSAVSTVRNEFIEATRVFAEPLSGVISRIGPMVRSWNLDEIFADAAKHVEPLADGVEAFASGVVRGAGALVKESGPAVAALADGMSRLGDAAEDAFVAIAENSEGGAEALHDALRGTAALVRGFGEVVGAAEAAYNWIHEHPIEAAIATGGLTLAITVYDKLGDTGTGVLTELSRQNIYAAESMEILGKATYNTAEAADAANAAFDRLFNEQMGVDQANLAVKEGLIELREELKKNGATLDENKQKGIDNKLAILDQIGVLNQQREAAIAAGNGTLESTKAANDAYRNQLAQLRKLLIEMGFAPAAIDAIINKYLQLAELPNITKTVRIAVYDESKGLYRGAGHSRQPGLAVGSPSAAPGLTWVGEHGPELVNFRGGERVWTTTQSQRLASAPAGAATAPASSRMPALPPMSVIEQALAAVVLKLIRTGQLPI